MADAESTAGEPDGGIEQVDWRQCSLCTPSDPAILPEILAYEPDKDLLLIATQTCSLVGKGAEPAFEVVAVRLIEEFNPAAPEAKGKITRFLQLPLEGGATGRGIRLDVSRRVILPSAHLQQMKPAQAQVSERALKAFQGWIARYYARIALPDELDRRLRKRQFHKKVEKALGQMLMDGTEAYKVHTDVDRIYIAWSPDSELSGDDVYTVKVRIPMMSAVCSDAMSAGDSD